eukprot:TRINITY_DN25450_c0_g1_i1.p1 TRINITY_DN25450_c0_g1~~TRINITY_DN25450_c0_g1_i1.p1  ORF type:complete len:894 (+),score=126.94 TRINITY_DN25450_c0_g1_i1:386-2683(+)
MTRFEGFDSKMYFRTLGMKKLLYADDTDPLSNSFTLINDAASFYTWLSSTVPRVWPTTPTNIMLGYMHLRQWRISQTSCHTGASLNALSPSARSLTTSCYPSYSSSQLSTDPYGPSLQWKANKDVPNSLDSVAVDGLLHNYVELGSAFSLLYRYADPIGPVQAGVDALQGLGWIDVQTRAVAIGLVAYNQPDATFVHLELCVEITESGVWLPSTRSKAFTFFSLEGVNDYTVMVLDSLMLLWVLKELISVVIAIKQQQELNLKGYFTLGGWNMFILLTLGVFGYYLYLRVILWTTGLSITQSYYADRSTDFGGDADKTMQELLTTYGDTYTSCFNTLAVLTALSFLRLFQFIQYNRRVSMLTETVKVSLTNIISLGIIFIIVLAGYAVWGHMLYGHHIEGFRDLVRAAGTLLRALVLGTLAEYREMSDIFSVWTAVYFTTYFILSWLLILNAVLAVVTGGFMMVQEHCFGDTGRWSPISLFKESKKWWLKIRNKHLTYMADADHEDYTREEKYLESRMMSFVILKEWYYSDQSTPEYISKSKLTELLGGPDGVLCESSIDHLYRKAGRKQAMGTHAIRLGERWASQIQSRTRAMEGILSKLQSYPLDKIQAISGVVEAMDNKVEKTKGTLDEVHRNTGYLVKDVQGISHSASAAAIRESKMMHEVKKTNRKMAYSQYPSYPSYPYQPYYDPYAPPVAPEQPNRKKKKSKHRHSPLDTPLLPMVSHEAMGEGGHGYIDPTLGWDQPDLSMTQDERRKYLPNGKLDV